MPYPPTAWLTHWPALACRRHRDDAKYVLRDKRIDRPGEIVLRRRAVSRIALVVCAAGLAAAVAGCKNSMQLFQDNSEGGWFSKPVDVFAKPDWASADRRRQECPAQSRGPVASGGTGRRRRPLRRAGRRAAAAGAAAAAAAAAAGRPAGRLHGRRSRPRADAGRHPGLGQSQCRPAGQPRRSPGHGRHRARHERMRRGAARRAARQRQYRRRRQRRAQGRAHLSERHLARHLHFRRRPAEGRRPRARAAGPGQAAGEKAKSQEKPAKPKTATREIERAYVQ